MPGVFFFLFFLFHHLHLFFLSTFTVALFSFSPCFINYDVIQ
jgi:hypothetical protein